MLHDMTHRSPKQQNPQFIFLLTTLTTTVYWNRIILSDTIDTEQAYNHADETKDAS